MEKRLQELLKIYEEENKFADLDFVNVVFRSLVDHYGDNGVVNVLVESFGKNGYSDFSTSTIHIDLDFIKINLLSKFCYDDLKSNLYLVNIFVILVLLHEFNHFKQRKKIDRVINSEDFLDKLFVNSYMFLCSNDISLVNKYNNTNYSSLSEVEDFYNEYHDCFAIERLAQLEANHTVNNIIEPISSSIGKVYYWFLNNYYVYKLREYFLLSDGILSPIDLLLSSMCDDINENDEYEYNGDDIVSNEESDNFYEELISIYTLDERVGYGLPITEDEYHSMVSYINIMYTLSGNKSISMYDEKIKKKVK